jgi:hypothetical protein
MANHPDTGRDDHGTGERDPREERVVEELHELHDEKQATEDPATFREAFEQEAAQLGLSEEAGEVGEET